MTTSPPEGPVVCLTGGSGEIATAIAKRLTRDDRGCVILTDIKPEPKGWFDPGPDGDARIVHASADVLDPSAMVALFDEIVKRYGRVDGLVNCAGITVRGAVADLTRQDWDRVIGVNLTGTFLASQAAGRVMIAQGRGSIVNIGSTAGDAAFPGRAAYCVSKAGVDMLTRVLAVEWAVRGVRVNCVSPAHANTRMAREAIAGGFVDAESLKKRIPLGRMAEPAEIADAVAFLLSDEARFITGANLAVDGGWTALGLY